jgi:hypothetical protein
MPKATSNQTPRAHERFRIRCWLTIFVNRRKIPVRAVDLNGSGVTVQSLFPVAVGAQVQVRSSVPLLGGNAHVRYCQRRGLVYRIGLQFSRPLAARF